MRTHDQLGGLIWIILAVSLCIGSIKLKLGGFRNPGPGFLPFLTGIVLGILGIILIFSRISKEIAKDEKLTRKGRNLLIPFLTLLISFAYVLLFEPLGFLPATFLFLFFLFKLSEPKKWLKPLILSLSVVILSYLIFSVWLQCQFPRGMFRF